VGQILRDEHVRLGDIVLYKESKGYVPAIVETIFPCGENDKFPALGLVVLITGFHLAAYPKSRVEHGEKDEQYLFPKQALKLQEDQEQVLKDEIGLSELRKKAAESAADPERKSEESEAVTADTEEKKRPGRK